MSQKQVQLKDGTAATLTVNPLPPGDEGVVKTLSFMIEFALEARGDAKIQQLSKELRGADDIDTITRMFRYVVRTFPYVRDPNDSEFLTHPKHLIRKRSPYTYLDCDDLSMLLASLLLAGGFRVGYRVIAWRRPEYTHVFPVVFVNNQWRPLDPVMKEAGLFNQRPVKYRQSDVEIRAGITPTLNDGDSPQIDYKQLLAEISGSILTGKDPVEVLKDKMGDICVQGFKDKIRENKAKIIAGCVAGILVIGAGGYGIGKAIEKRSK